MARTQSLTPFLLGALVALGFSSLIHDRGLPAAYGAGTASDGGIYMVTNGGSQTQGKDLLFLVESSEEFGRRLAVYEWSGDRLQLGAVRNIAYDFGFESWSKEKRPQEPSVADQKKLNEKREERSGGKSRPK